MTATIDKPRVLVVDDNHDAATTLSFLLETAGYQVETCFDGVHALAAAEAFAPDACVLDINMPGMNGYELAKKLREKDPEHAPVIATVTAYEDYGHLEKAVDAGFDLHFTKPANYLEVAEQLADSIKKAHPAGPRIDQSKVDTSEVAALTSAELVSAEMPKSKQSDVQAASVSESKVEPATGNWIGIASITLASVVLLAVLVLVIL